MVWAIGPRLMLSKARKSAETNGPNHAGRMLVEPAMEVSLGEQSLAETTGIEFISRNRSFASAHQFHHLPISKSAEAIVRGHLIGDDVTLLVASILKSSFQATDRVYRFDREEFIVTLRCSASGMRRRWRLRSGFDAISRLTTSYKPAVLLPAWA
jgi:hypothetical protein